MRPARSFSAVVVALMLAAPVSAGIVNSPLPILPATGKQSKLVYSTTGVSHEANMYATCFNCSSVDKNLVEVGVEIFNFDGTLLNDAASGNGTVSIAPGETRTMCTQETGFYAEDELMTLTSDARQGSARIVATSTKILCNAQALDLGDPPTSIATLPIFGKFKQKGD